MTSNRYGTQSDAKASLSNLIRVFNKKAKRVLIWPLAAFVISLIGWSALLKDFADLRQSFERDALSDTAALSQSYAESLQRAIELVDHLISHVRYENEITQGKLRLEEVSRRGIFPSPSLLYITLVDRNGIPYTSTGPLNRDVNYKNDQVFLMQQADAKDVLYIGKPVSGAVAEQNVVPISRKLLDDAGNFVGIVLAFVTPEYLAAGYS